MPTMTQQQVDDYYRRRAANSDLRARNEQEAQSVAAIVPTSLKPAKRIRQSSKPLMNKLETEWFNHINSLIQNGLDKLSPVKYLRAQALKFKIGTNAFYKPDFTAMVGNQFTAWECKGMRGKNLDRGKLALKVAAFQWPEIRFVLVWKEDGQWQTQEILP